MPDGGWKTDTFSAIYCLKLARVAGFCPACGCAAAAPAGRRNAEGRLALCQACGTAGMRLPVRQRCVAGRCASGGEVAQVVDFRPSGRKRKPAVHGHSRFVPAVCNLVIIHGRQEQAPWQGANPAPARMGGRCCRTGVCAYRCFFAGQARFLAVRQCRLRAVSGTKGLQEKDAQRKQRRGAQSALAGVFNHGCHTHAAADTKGGQAQPGVLLPHGVQQGDKNAAP